MTNAIKHQSMRIAGKKVDAEKKINSFLSNEKLNNYDAFYYAIAGAM